MKIDTFYFNDISDYNDIIEYLTNNIEMKYYGIENIFGNGKTYYNENGEMIGYALDSIVPQKVRFVQCIACKPRATALHSGSQPLWRAMPGYWHCTIR